jgi:hypothetical protein
MAEPSRYDDTGGTPRWVKVAGIVALVVALLVVVMLLIGGGGGHGPQRHGGAGGATAPPGVTASAGIGGHTLPAGVPTPEIGLTSTSLQPINDPAVQCSPAPKTKGRTLWDL